MRVPIAVVIAGALVAVAILIAFRWHISAATGVVYRLDRWSGRIIACELSGYTPCYNIGPTR
jgi:hypothetical protein